MSDKVPKGIQLGDREGHTLEETLIGHEIQQSDPVDFKAMSYPKLLVYATNSCRTDDERKAANE